jgi:parallel beta-helix repeat protein
MVRLDGDYASISNVWLSGPGQVLNTVNGRRGIWIGSGLNRAATCNVSYARVENMFIDQFIGNAISGDYTYAKILNNDIQNTTDAAIFLQPSSTNNLIQGNTITGSRYSGIDINGSTTESSGITSRVTAAVPQIRRLKAESSLPKTAAVFRPASISSKATG